MNICKTCIHRNVCEWETTDDNFKRCNDYIPNIVESLCYEEGPQGKFLTIKLQLDTLENNHG